MENNYSEITLLSNNVYVVNDRNINWGGEVNHNFEILNNLNKNANLKIKYNGQEVNYRVTGDNLEVDLNDLTPANGIFTLNVNGEYLTAFSANQKTDLSANIQIPTKTSDLDNDAEFITLNDVPSVDVPSKVSELQNDSGFITLNDVNIPTKVSQLQNDSGYLTSADLPQTEIPTKTSDLTNDSGFITSDDLPEISVPTKTSDLNNDSGFITSSDVPVTNGVLTLKKDGQVLGTFSASESKTINFESSSFQTFETERFTVINAIKIAISEGVISELGYSLQTFVPYNFFSKIQYRCDKSPLIRGAYYKETQVIDDVTYYVALIPVTAEFLLQDTLDVFIPYYQIPKYLNKFITTTSNDGHNFFKLSGSDFGEFEGSQTDAENRSFTRILPNTNISEVF